MLSKVGGATTIQEILTDFEGAVTNSSGQTKELWSYTINQSVKIYYNIKGYGNYSCQISIYNGGNIVATSDKGQELNGNFTPSAGTTLKVSAYNYNYSGSANVKYKVYYDKIVLDKPNNNSGKPRELNSIGNKASITIFGVHTDNERIADNDSLALSSYLEFCNKKGTNHTQTIAGSSTMQYYTFTGYGTAYGYHTTAGSSGTTLMLEDIGAYIVFYGLIKCKPGDKIRIAGAGANLQINDFY